MGKVIAFLSLEPSCLDLSRDVPLYIDNSWVNFPFFMIRVRVTHDILFWSDQGLASVSRVGYMFLLAPDMFRHQGPPLANMYNAIILLSFTATLW